jgi:hypothetical protein
VVASRAAVAATAALACKRNARLRSDFSELREGDVKGATPTTSIKIAATKNIALTTTLKTRQFMIFLFAKKTD